MLAAALRGSRNGSAPKTRTVPLSGANSPQTARIAVVLPAPSGPMTPNISPAFTSNDTPSRATVASNFLRRPSTATTDAMASTSLQTQIDFHRHAGLQHALAVVDGDLDSIHELRALVGRLDIARRELGLRRNERHTSFDPIATVGDDRGGLVDA